jgi:hypothetical protein
VVTAAFVGGAVAAGRAHARSDVDVYVITELLDPVEPTDHEYRGGNGELIPFLLRNGRDGYRLDVEYWREAQVDHVFTRIADRPLGGPRLIGLNVGEDDLDFLSDVWSGYSLVSPSWLSARQKTLRGLRLDLLVASRRFSQADSSIEDALGLLESGDEPSAVLAAALAFAFVVDGLAAAAGELSPNPKWRAQKVLRARPAVLSWETYWDIETRSGLAAAPPDVWVRDVLAQCQALMLSVDFG